MEKPECNQKVTLTIKDLGAYGEGVASLNGYTIFVERTLPGEVIEARIIESKKKFGRAKLERLIKPSPDRVKPSCPAFEKCGGCQIMHLSYEKQLEIKHKKVIAALERIGKLVDVKVHPCIPSPSPLHYRNKIQLLAQKGTKGVEIGLCARNSHDLIPIKKCFIHNPLGEEVFKEIREVLTQTTLIPYDEKSKKGELRQVVIKTSLAKEQILVTLISEGNASKALQKVAKEIKKCSKLVAGVVINKARGNGNYFPRERGVGESHIYEELCGLTFKVSSASFFQVNSKQAEQLYATVLKFSDIAPTDIILDAFCGVGTITLYLAQHAKQVIGIECVSAAIRDAKENAKLNEISNVSFQCGLVEKIIKEIQRVDLLLINPPRGGCSPLFLKEIERLTPKKIVYVSCDPATLARDLAVLKKMGYSIEVVQPFDMFPQTAHVECVVKLVF